MGAITLSGLNVYPVKSAAGIALSTARVDPRGLAGDRRWVVVGGKRAGLPQRTPPRLALVSVAIALGAGPRVGAHWVLTAVWHNHNSRKAPGVRVWDDV